MNIENDVDEIVSTADKKLDGKKNSDCKEFLDQLLEKIQDLRDTFGE